MGPKFVCESPKAFDAPKFRWPPTTRIENRVVSSGLEGGVLRLSLVIRPGSDGKLKVTVQETDYTLDSGEGMAWDSALYHHYEVLEPASFIIVLAPKRP